MSDYAAFLDSKRQLGGNHGFDPVWQPNFLYDFQTDLTAWAIRKGRAAIFADCGLGKTPMQLVWAENVVRHTSKRVLILTPLAVAAQTHREAEKFGITAEVSREGGGSAPITITNYERLHYFSPADFCGVVCDESSILKNFDGSTRKAITEFARLLPFRLLCTATAAPNDYMELGTSSEALGYLGQADMLSRFFRRATKIYIQREAHAGEAFRLRPHAARDFWRWVCSWARAVRKPSDMGYEDNGFKLPELITRNHIVTARTKRDDFLFDVPAVGLQEQRKERRRTLSERCEMAASLVKAEAGPSISWCHLNDEGDLLGELIPNSVQVKGEQSAEFKEDAVAWFCGLMCNCKLTSKYSWVKLPPCSQNDKSICGTTTERTEGNTSARGRNRTKSMPQDGGGTRQTSPLRNSAESRRGNGTRLGNETPESGHNSESRQGGMPQCSGNRAEVARFAADGTATEPGGDSPLTMTTRPGESEDFSATTAIRQSASLRTIPRCCCEHPSTLKRTLISKPTIFGYGLNLQHCAHQTFFPSHSFEQWYQAVRRSWRFGQKRQVVVDVISSEGERDVLANLQRKSEAADQMFAQLVSLMHDSLRVDKSEYAEKRQEIPSWLK